MPNGTPSIKKTFLYTDSIIKLIDVIGYIADKPFQRGNRLPTSESDVFIRQILTYKDGPRTEVVSRLLLLQVDENNLDLSN